MRLTTKPASSSDCTTCLPSVSAKARIRVTVSAEVASPGITSISCITGTGLKKCRPTKRAGSGEAAAMRVIGIELVLLAMMAFAASTLPALSKMRRLMSSRSVAASMISSASAMGA